MSGILNAFVGGSYGSKPAAPTIGTATATGTTTATVSYTAPAFDGGVAITSYTATSSPGGLTGTLSTAGSGTITVTGLTSGTAYTFTVAATNSVGTGASSAASNSITAWIAPANTFAPVVSGTATVRQTLVTTDGTWTGSPTPTFTYQWQRTGSNIGGANANTYTLVDADAANTIRCVVTGTNAAGNSSANSNSTASVASTVPTAPQSVSASSTGYTTATVTWSAPSGTGGSAITGYNISWSGGSVTGVTSPASITGLSASTSYTFTVTAVNANGSSAGTASNSITTFTAAGYSYGGGYWAGVFNGYNLVVAPKATGYTSGVYGMTNGAPSPLYGNSSFTDGVSNTNTLYNGTNGTGYAPNIATWCKGINNSGGINGYTDWYIPSPFELQMMYYWLKPDTGNNQTNIPSDGYYSVAQEYYYGNGQYYAQPLYGPGYNPFAGAGYSVPSTGWTATGFPTQTPTAAFQSGGSEAFDTTMWTSKEDSIYSGNVGFNSGGGGGVSGYYKASAFGCRLVRRA